MKKAIVIIVMKIREVRNSLGILAMAFIVFCMNSCQCKSIEDNKNREIELKIKSIGFTDDIGGKSFNVTWKL